MSDYIVLRLPYPPTVNTYWRRVGNKTLISKRGRIYRKEVEAVVGMRPDRLAGRLAVEIRVNAPDNRVRDLDNLPKAILDALTKAEVWVDDSQIDDLRIFRGKVGKPGSAEVRILEISE